MKKLDTSLVTDDSRLPLKEGSIEFLQQSYQECFSATIQALIGDTYSSSVVYRLFGAKFHSISTTSGISIDAGFVYSNGEIYQVDAAIIDLEGYTHIDSQVLITQFTSNADPVEFTDGSSYNIHNIRKCVFVPTNATSTIGLGFVSASGPTDIPLTPPVWTGAGFVYESPFTATTNGAYYPITFQVDSRNKIARLSGVCENNTNNIEGGTAHPFGTLPISARPAKSVSFVGQFYNATTENFSTCIIDIGSSGVVFVTPQSDSIEGFEIHVEGTYRLI